MSHLWRFYLSPREAWEAMYQDCARAMTSIEMEQYIFENDSVGQRFLELFIRKAAEGVRVFVLCDRFGSAAFLHSPLIQKLREAGGRFYFYHDIRFLDIFRPWRLFPRTHIKTLLVDSRIAYTGGVCMAERMVDWRDTQIKIIGPVVAQIKKSFEHVDKPFFRRRRKPALQEPNEEDFIYVQSNPVYCRCMIYPRLVEATKNAKRYIYITTPFFAPNRRFRRLLRQMAAKGIDVILLVPQRSDVIFADWMMLSYAKKLLKAGVKVFRYKGVPIHCKTIVIDDEWATIGSTNIDVLSFFHNRESNLIIRNAEAIADLKRHFLSDLEQSRELTLEEWAREPLYKRILGRFAREAKRFLK